MEYSKAENFTNNWRTTGNFHQIFAVPVENLLSYFGYHVEKIKRKREYNGNSIAYTVDKAHCVVVLGASRS